MKKEKKIVVAVVCGICVALGLYAAVLAHHGTEADNLAVQEEPVVAVQEELADVHEEPVQEEPAMEVTEEISRNKWDDKSYMVVFGDSWAEGWGVGGDYPDAAGYDYVSQCRYTRLLADSLGLAELNYAVGGAGYVVGNVNTSSEVPWNTLAAQVEVALETGNAYHNTLTREQIDGTGLVLIAGGWNDASRIEEQGVNFDEMLAAVDYMVSICVNTFPDAQAVFAFSQSATDVVDVTIPEYFTDWMDAINSYVEEYYPEVIVTGDFGKCLEGNYDYFMYDCLHPNDEGHRIVAEGLYQKIVNW